MELLLTSTDFDDVSTEGQLSVDGLFECYTLELPWTDGSVGTAIPEGRFQIVLQPSPDFIELAARDPWFEKYARQMPHIVGIPGRSLIMLHPGNFVHSTKGCVLVGQTKGKDFIGSSKAAFANLFDLISPYAISGDCF